MIHISSRRLFYVLVMLSATLIAIATVNAEKDSMEGFKSLEIGMAAPDFTLKDGEGAERSIRDYLGQKNVVLAFYPKDFTGG